MIAEEDQEILKVGLLTKIAGNYKRANDAQNCIEASTEAYELIKRLSGEVDPQSRFAAAVGPTPSETSSEKVAFSTARRGSKTAKFEAGESSKYVYM